MEPPFLSNGRRRGRETWEFSNWTLPLHTLLLYCCRTHPGSLTNPFLSFPLSRLPNTLLSQARLTRPLNFSFCFLSKKRKEKRPDELIRFLFLFSSSRPAALSDPFLNSPSVWSLRKPRKFD